MRGSTPLFIYGTLLFPEVLRAVMNLDPGEPILAQATHCLRRGIRGQLYPGLLRGHGSVAGHLRHLHKSALVKLDHFEGDMYRRLPVVVLIEGGRRVQAEAYFVQPNALSHVLQTEWDEEAFVKRHLRTFLAGLTGRD